MISLTPELIARTVPGGLLVAGIIFGVGYLLARNKPHPKREAAIRKSAIWGVSIGLLMSVAFVWVQLQQGSQRAEVRESSINEFIDSVNTQCLPVCAEQGYDDEPCVRYCSCVDAAIRDTGIAMPYFSSIGTKTEQDAMYAFNKELRTLAQSCQERHFAN